LQAIESFDNLKEHAKFKQWLFRIITNCFYDSIRGSIWKKFLQLDTYEGRDNIPDIYNQFDMSEKSELLNKALTRLNAKERITILLFEVSKFTIEEIVEIQKEKSLSAVKSRLSRTREKLKNIIIKLENDNIYKTNNILESNITKKSGNVEIL
jgi:RNA polymerase sigma factor (sigma-70 family)